MAPEQQAQPRGTETRNQKIGLLRRKCAAPGYIIFLLLCILQLGSAESFEPYKSADHYDQYFKEYSQRFFGDDFDWRYFKAQAITESRLKAMAHSDNGAMGIMQILPATFDEVCSEVADVQADPWHPRWNIAAAIYYNRMLWETWHADRSRIDRMCFMFASYIAGKRRILEAQQKALKLGLNPFQWITMEKVLPDVLGTPARRPLPMCATF